MNELLPPPRWSRYYPEGLSWHKSYAPRTLPDVFDDAVRRFKDKPCLHFLGRSMSYGQIAEQVDLAARGLLEHGIGKGDRVGLLLPNSPTYVIFYHAVLKTGATVVNFNPLYSPPELRHQIEDSGTRLMVTHDLKLTFDKVAALIEEGALRSAIVAPFKDLLPFATSLLFRLFKGGTLADWRRADCREHLIELDILLDNDGAPVKAAIDPERDIAVLQYTGGTTGVPKGAMLSHANLTINVEQIGDWAGNLRHGEERIMGILPFFHVFAMTTILNFGIRYGMELLLVPKFELDEALKLIHRFQPSVMPGVPTLFSAILNHPKRDSYDLSSLTFCVSGGAGLPLSVKQEFEQVADCSLVEGYGLSETSPVATANPVDGPVRDGSIGLPLAATSISIRSLEEPGREMPIGESGEICIKGPQVMQGYWQKPEENENSFIDGCFRTGDVGYMAEDGFLYLVDRVKDMINASGFKIYPRQVEDAIYRHPAVAEVTVIGIPDEYRGEAPKAFIKLKEGQSATQQDILDFLRGEISKLEMPEEIEFRDELPKTMIGKLSRKELRQEQEPK